MCLLRSPDMSKGGRAVFQASTGKGGGPGDRGQGTPQLPYLTHACRCSLTWPAGVPSHGLATNSYHSLCLPASFLPCGLQLAWSQTRPCRMQGQSGTLVAALHRASAQRSSRTQAPRIRNRIGASRPVSRIRTRISTKQMACGIRLTVDSTPACWILRSQPCCGLYPPKPQQHACCCHMRTFLKTLGPKENIPDTKHETARHKKLVLVLQSGSLPESWNLGHKYQTPGPFLHASCCPPLHRPLVVPMLEVWALQGSQSFRCR